MLYTDFGPEAEAIEDGRPPLRRPGARVPAALDPGDRRAGPGRRGARGLQRRLRVGDARLRPRDRAAAGAGAAGRPAAGDRRARRLHGRGRRPLGDRPRRLRHRRGAAGARRASTSSRRCSCWRPCWRARRGARRPGRRCSRPGSRSRRSRSRSSRRCCAASATSAGSRSRPRSRSLVAAAIVLACGDEFASAISYHTERGLQIESRRRDAARDRRDRRRRPRRRSTARAASTSSAGGADAGAGDLDRRCWSSSTGSCSGRAGARASRT